MDELYKGLAETLAKEKNGKYVKTIDTAASRWKRTPWNEAFAPWQC